MGDRIEHLIDALTGKVDEALALIRIHDQKMSGNSEAIREDSSHLAAVLDRMVDVLTRMEIRLANGHEPKGAQAGKLFLDQNTVKLGLIVALAVAMGRLGSEGVQELAALVGRLMGWGH